MSGAAFDPLVVRDHLKSLLKGREKTRLNSHKNDDEWLIKWEREWTFKSVQTRIARWKTAGCIGTDAQMEFVSHVCEYMVILHRAAFGFNGSVKLLPEGFPIYGPVFYPPTVGHRNFMKVTVSNDITQMFKSEKDFPKSRIFSVEDALVEPVHIMSPVYFPKLGLIEHKCPVSNCTHKLERNGFTSSGFRSMYGLTSNLKVLGMDFKCEEHGKFSTTSPNKFWSHFDPWLLRDIPHFHERSAYTRELYDFITEFRLQSSIGQLTESIHQLHLLETYRRRSVWLEYAITNKAKLLKKGYSLEFPQVLHISDDKSVEINTAPSETSIRNLYDHFFENQRRKESEQYLRSLTGRILGIDATVKLANKANIYTVVKTDSSNDVDGGHKKQAEITVFNPFEGGMLTAVNEDKELVFWELLRTNSPLEMLAPLLEYAERCDVLGINFKEIGEICVDRCCDFRPALKMVFPNISVVQDLMHLKGRILDTVSKKSAHREAVSSDLTKALVVRSASQGKPAVYHSTEDQHQPLLSVFDKYQRLGSVWTTASESAVENQVTHIINGCLQRRHADLPSHTSGNENWHGRLNTLSRGDASSLPTIISLVTDAVLRFNLNTKINNLSQPGDSMARQFRAKANGFHHLFLLDYVLRQTEELLGVDQPVFLSICPEHKFGIVKRQFDSYNNKTSRIQALRQNYKGDQKVDPLIDNFIEQVTLNGEADSLTLSLNEKRSYSQFFDRPEGGSTIFSDDDSMALDNKLSAVQNVNKRLKVSSDNKTAEPSSSQNLFPIFRKHSALEDDVTQPVTVETQRNESRLSTHSGGTQSTFESRSVAMLSTVLTTQSATEYISASSINQGDRAHWRFAACRVTFGWTSTMSSQQWKEAALHYNNSNTDFHPSLYENHDFPNDPNYRDAEVLKKYCLEFEKLVWRWKQKQDNGEQLSPWILRQLAILPPELSSIMHYSKLTKTGKRARIKTCHRCNRPCDFQGNNHPRDNCSDGFFSWDHVPFPLPSPPDIPSLTFRNGGKLFISPVACVSAFQKALSEKRVAEDSSQELEKVWKHVLIFEKLARKNINEGIESAVRQGQEAYDFDTASRFKSDKRRRG